MAATILILPGYGDSGPEHWQTLWERRHGYGRVMQDDWERPTLDAWKRRLDEAMAGVRGEIVLVVGGAPERSGVDPAAVEAVRTLVESGARAKVAAKVVAELTGAPANALYREVAT